MTVRLRLIDSRKRMARKILIQMIKFYQKYLSPLKTTKCPYIPTCSNYGLQAIEKYGAFKGDFLLYGEFSDAIRFPTAVMTRFHD